MSYSASEWREAIEHGLRSGRLTREAATTALGEIDAHAAESLSPALVGSIAGIDPDLIEALLGLARNLPREPSPTPTVLDEAATPSTTGSDGWPPGYPRRLGPYVLERVMGEGGMGMVFAARHSTLGTRCAVKAIPLDKLTDDSRGATAAPPSSPTTSGGSCAASRSSRGALPGRERR